MITAVDTNILLDILDRDPDFLDLSREAIERCLDEGRLILSDVVYSELAARFLSAAELDGFLAQSGIALIRTSREALFAAGQAWQTYAARRRPEFVCQSCGLQQTFECRRCGSIVRARQHLVADFLIGGHAMAEADRLLTRDRGYFRTYFPELHLLET